MSDRTYIKHTKGSERGWRIASLIIFLLGLLIVSWDLGWIGGSTFPSGVWTLGAFMLFAGTSWFILNELTARGHGFLGEPRGSGWVRRFIREAEADNRVALARLRDIRRFVDFYALDLPPDLRERIRLIKQELL